MPLSLLHQCANRDLFHSFGFYSWLFALLHVFTLAVGTLVDLHCTLSLWHLGQILTNSPEPLIDMMKEEERVRKKYKKEKDTKKNE